MTITPFSGPNYRRNMQRGSADATPCALCGKPIKEPWPYVVRVIGGGASFAELDAPDDGGGEMGAHPVGPDCAAKLRAAGVPVGIGAS